MKKEPSETVCIDQSINSSIQEKSCCEEGKCGTSDCGCETEAKFVNETFSGESCGTSSDCACGSVSLKVTEPEKYEWGTKLKPFIISFTLGIIGFLLENFVENPIMEYLALTIFIVSYGISSYGVILRVIKNLNIKTIFDENFLMLIATLGAIFTANFLEAIAVMLFYKGGEIIEGYGVFKSKKSISSLLENLPEMARVITPFGNEETHPRLVKIGERLLVKPGEKIPLDGKLLSDYSLFNTSVLTGESVPRRIILNGQILSGMVNLSHLIEYEVTQTFENSAISRILDLVQNAESNKSKTEKFTKRFAKYYTPGVVIAAFLLAVIPPIFIADASFGDWLYRAMIFLVISCPCALVLSVPLTYFGGIGAASRHGILIKGTQHLETLADLDTFVFDKTGTITKGNFKVIDIKPVDGITANEFLSILASAEAFSNHPVAKSIIESYGESNLSRSLYTIEKFKEIPALGINALVDGKEFIAGSDKILHEFAILHDESYCRIGGTVVHVAIDKKYMGYLIISDELREESNNSLQMLRRVGIKKIVMLSGDDEKIVSKLAHQLKFDEFHSELLPEEKVAQFEKLKTNPSVIGYVGDGINDAPVIARADVGFAMGELGSDAAIESADVVLMTDHISKIHQSIQIAKRTRFINWQNIFLIFLVKGLFLGLGAFGLMSMWGAVFADVGMAMIAIVNSRRILTYIPK